MYSFSVKGFKSFKNLKNLAKPYIGVSMADRIGREDEQLSLLV